MFRDTLSGQIKHSTQSIFAGEAGLVFGDLPELTIQTLNVIRRVYDLLNIRQIFKKCGQNVPVFLPAFYAFTTEYESENILLQSASIAWLEHFLISLDKTRHMNLR